ncbi:hypothetical protein HF086_004335 [Spodoptera exigua]|nr:hypothetical protein HF086_004335 [Spodoptera exigua]
MDVVFADNVEENNEISNIPYSHEIEIQNTSEPNLPVVSVISEQHLTLPADKIASTSLPKTPIKLNLTPVQLNDILILPKTPQRKGTKNSEKIPFVLTSEEWQRINTEKKKAKELKEEGIKKRKLEREQKKLQKDQTQRKGKGKGKKTGGNIQNVKKIIMSKEFYSPPPDVNDKENAAQSIQNRAEFDLFDSPIEKQEDYSFPSTSREIVKKSFTASEIFRMLTDSDDEDN